jgi:hypothetical protein
MNQGFQAGTRCLPIFPIVDALGDLYIVAFLSLPYSFEFRYAYGRTGGYKQPYITCPNLTAVHGNISGAHGVNYWKCVHGPAHLGTDSFLVQASNLESRYGGC